MTRADIQAFNNVIYGLRHYNLDAIVGPVVRVEQDRVVFRCSEAVEPILNRNANFGRWQFCKNHGSDAFASWRENVGSCSMQITLHRRTGIVEAEIDYDYGRPGWDAVGWVVHAWEVANNKLRKRKTDPFKVRAKLNARGYDIPLAEEA